MLSKIESHTGYAYMPAKHHIDNESNLIVTTWEGDASETGFIKVLLKYQKNIQCHPDYIDYNEIFNLSDATNLKITIGGLMSIGRVASRTDHLFAHKKLALIVGSNMAFSFARMYEAYRNIGIRSSKKIRVFKNESKALEWVKEK